MKVFDNYEICPCCRVDDAGLPDPSGLTYEVCDPVEADVWWLYGHIDGEGIQAIGMFGSREEAEDVFQRITGIPFTSSREVQERLRVMHTAPRLLQALQSCYAELGEMLRIAPDNQMADTIDANMSEVRSAIAEATGRAA